MTVVAPAETESLVAYLSEIGGKEIYIFTDENNQADLNQARKFAEKLRAVHKDYINELVTIEQSYNRVTFKLVA
jgi:hypothetical protein